jgi:RNA polymerase sigma-70 factor (ECF subfamily)
MSIAAVASASVRRATDDSRLDGDAAVFGEVRSRLMGIAYRILGSWCDAEDVVQDAWLRWQRYDRTTVVNPTAFLVTTTTRLAINAAQCARARREWYVGQWLPEPVATGDDPASGVEHSDVLRLGILVLLERLAPTERAAYVLYEAFDYPYPQIAQILQTTDVNARQLVSRARKHIARSRCRPANRDGNRRLLQAFVAAAGHGDVDDLEKFFASEVVNQPGEEQSTAWRTSGDAARSRRRRQLEAASDPTRPRRP